MMGSNSYGKDGIRLVRVRRDGERHDLVDLTVDIRLTGDFEAAHVAGDNSAVLPTDTMRGTAYAFARDGVAEIEEFAQRLARHFVETVPACTTARVRIARAPWVRIGGEDGAAGHDHGFTAGPAGQRTTVVTHGPDGAVVESGLADVLLLKTTGSAFSGFLRDRFTTLQETDDRIMATSMTARWGFREGAVDWSKSADAVKQVLFSTFADHDDSQSLQHTLHVMGEAVLAARPEVAWVHMVMPNKHHIAVDLSPYGLDNPGEVFLATDRPYGLIEGTVVRPG